MKYHFQIHSDKDGLWAECMELDGCDTCADTYEELKEMMKDALNLYLDDPVIKFPLPDETIQLGNNIALVEVDKEIAKKVLLNHK